MYYTANCGWFKREESIVGTSISVELWSDCLADGDAAMDVAIEEMHCIDLAKSPRKADSELSRIKRDAGNEPVPVGGEIFHLLAHAEYFARLS